VKLLSLRSRPPPTAPKLKHDDVPKPEFYGVRTLSSEKFDARRCDCGSAHGHDGRILHQAGRLGPFIDWTPFFHTWELRGVYPKILQHEKHGEESHQAVCRRAISCWLNSLRHTINRVAGNRP